MIDATQFFDALKGLGFETAADRIIGAWRGYVFSVRSQGRGYVMDSRVRTELAEKGAFKTVSSSLRKQFPQMKPQVMFGKGFLQTVFRLRDDASAATLRPNPAFTFAPNGDVYQNHSGEH